MQKCGPVPTTLHIIFARPHHLYFGWSPDRLGDVNCFHDEVRLRIGATAETATEKSSVQLHLLIGETSDFCGVGAVDGLKLRTGPDFTRILAQVYHAIQGLHHQMREIRSLVY